MKTIEKGIINPDKWTLEITCPHCGSVLEICIDDITMYTRQRPIFLFFSKFEECFDVTCPECSLDIALDDRDIPNIIKDNLVSKMSVGEVITYYYYNRYK